MIMNTVRLHRVLRANPEKVYRAFLEADAIAKWLPPYGFTCRVEHMDASVGGTYRMSFTNFSTGNGHSFGGGVATMREYLRAGLVDEIHLAISPILLGSGEHLFTGIDMLALGYDCVEHVPTQKATHVVLIKNA
ncbi:MAG: dihydrofolate reductase family protein [Gallionella sp.]|nr:dihydrofolate reductase family protein [Gallionella sp.]